MSDSDDDLILPSLEELAKAVEADNEKNKDASGNEMENTSDDEAVKPSPKRVQRSAKLMIVDETEEESKYRKKNFCDVDSVVTSRKLRCTSCGNSLQSVLLDGRDVFFHPVLKVLMCKTCVGFYGDGNFSADEDGSDKYCRWCGQGGNLYCCAKCSCVFCKPCIKKNLNRSILVDIESDDWLCFVCSAEPLWELRAICENALTFSRKIRRKKRVENERNLKKLQKKQGTPVSRKHRRQNRWQKNKGSSTITSSSSSESSDENSSSDSEKDKKRKKKSMKSAPNKRKRRQASSSSDGDRKESKKKKDKADSDIAVVEIDEEGCILVTDSDNEKKKPKDKMKCKESSSKSNNEEGEIPEELDDEDVREVKDMFRDHLTDLMHSGELIAHRARRLIDKKVDNETNLTQWKNVEKVVDSINLLVKLAGENLQHTGDYLSSQHKHWQKQTIKRYRKSRAKKKSSEVNATGKQNGIDEQQGTQISTPNKNEDDEPMSLNEANESQETEFETKLSRRNAVLDVKEEKTKFNNEDLECEENFECRTILDAATEGTSESNKVEAAEREDRKRKDGNVSDGMEENSVDAVHAKKKMKLGSEDVENSTSMLDEGAICENNVEGGDSSEEEVEMGKEVSEKIAEAGEVNGVIESDVEEKDEKKLSVEKKNVLDDTDHSIGSLSTIRRKSLSPDMFSESFTGENVDGTEMEESKEVTNKEKDVEIKKGGEHSDSDSGSAATIELLYTQDVDPLADGCKNSDNSETENAILKNHNGVDNDPLALSESESTEAEKPEERKSEDEGDAMSQSLLNIDGKKNLDAEENGGDEEDKASDIGNEDDKGSDIGNEDDKGSDIGNEDDKGSDMGNEDDKGSDIGNLQLTPDNSDTEIEKKDTAEAKNEVEEAKETEDIIDECVAAEQALLGYSSDDEDEDEDKPKKKGKKKKDRLKKTKVEKDKTSKEEVEKSPQKRRAGPKSKTRVNLDSTSSSLSSTSTEDGSDDSSRRQQKKSEVGKKQKFRLKNTEAYKQDKKLGWKCEVDIAKLAQEKFDKYYKDYYSPEEEDSEKETKEILSLVNLKSLKKGREKKSKQNSDEESDDNDSDTGKKKRKPKKDKTKEQEQTLMDFFNEECNEDGAEDSSRSGDESGSEKKMEKLVKKKSVQEQENDIAMKSLLGSSSSEDEDLNEEQDAEPEDKKKKKKKKSKEKEVEEEEESNKMDVDKDESLPAESEKEEEEEKEEAAESKKDEDEEIEQEKKEEVEEKEEAAESKKDEDEEIEKEKKEDEEEEAIEKDAGDESEEDIDTDKLKKKGEETDEEDKEKDTEKKELDIEEKEKEEETDEEEKEKDSVKKEEDIEEKEKEDKKKDGDSSDESLTSKKKDWRKDKLLTERLDDLDTSDEERLWKKKREKVQSADNLKKKVRRRILGSEDEDEFNAPSSSSESKSNSSDSDIFVIKKKKKTGKKSDSDSKSSDSDSDFKTKKPKRKRIKAPASDSSSNEDDGDPSQKSTPGKGRKKIHHILSDDSVAEATRRAAREEEERRKRIAEKQKMYNDIFKVVEGVQTLEKLVLDFDPETKEELVSVDPNLVSKLKPHQAKGVKFMWDACFESLKRIKKMKGSGCILAHCMGLGKTFQIVTLVHTLLNHKDTGVNTVLVVCPLSTVLNWVNEFNMWLKGGKEVNVFELTRYKQNYERMYQVKDWQESGGVMVLGYDMYRNLTNPQAKRLRKKAIETFQSTLVDPGPDLVVCDEGHLLKNEDTAISKAMRRVRTLRRIVLTGTPLQNNLREYHCMVQFVKPNLLGTRKEFLNRFVNPITNGQFEDSTLHDVKIMKRRAHVLHKMLEGSVQRFDYSVLTPFLPPKYEYVISIRLSDMQEKAYLHYLDYFSQRSENNKGAQLFTDFNNLQRIWTHPRVLQMSSDKAEKMAEKRLLMESDSEGSLRDFIDDGSDSDNKSSDTSSNQSSSDDSDVQIVDGKDGEGDKKTKPNKYTRTTRSKGPAEEPEEEKKEEGKESVHGWWKQFIQGDELENIKYSGKLVLLFSILRECEKIGDKVLVFSQSLFSLNLIEYFLSCVDTSTQSGETKEELGHHTGSWSPGIDYFRLDGSTSTENRAIWCKTFNREDNHRARLFIISTKAGGLGINLFAANRVIMFDVSWNPSHDVQSIFRVYRFGQKKPCYIYRFVTQGTMEEKMYDRQVTKLSLSCRVVDEQQIERHYNMADLQELYRYDPEQKAKRPTPILPKDRLLAELLKEHEQWIVTYHEHDSLLENKQEEELNEEERQAAWEDYENEKKGKVLMPVLPMAGANLNMAALRDALKNENPTATDEQLEQKMGLIVSQIYDFVSNPQNHQAQPGAVSQPYTAAQMQALQQYQLQQQQIQAQREKYLKQQQEKTLKMAANTVAGFNPNANVSFQQYLQQMSSLPYGMVPMPSYPTNLYRNTSVEKPGVFRTQPKLVPINPNAPGAPKILMKNYSNPKSHLISRQPVMLPQKNMYSNPNPVSAGTSGYQSMLKDFQKKTLDKSETSSKNPVPDSEIETIE